MGERDVGAPCIALVWAIVSSSRLVVQTETRGRGREPDRESFRQSLEP